MSDSALVGAFLPCVTTPQGWRQHPKFSVERL